MGMKTLIEYIFSPKKDSRTRGHKITIAKDQCRLNIRKCSFSPKKDSRTRGHNITIAKDQCRLDIWKCSFSPKKGSRTRGHKITIAKDQCRLDIRKYSFSQRTMIEWNKLSADCVTASSVNMFKNKVDTYLRRASYT